MIEIETFYEMPQFTWVNATSQPIHFCFKTIFTFTSTDIPKNHNYSQHVMKTNFQNDSVDLRVQAYIGRRNAVRRVADRASPTFRFTEDGKTNFFCAAILKLWCLIQRTHPRCLICPVKREKLVLACFRSVTTRRPNSFEDGRRAVTDQKQGLWRSCAAQNADRCPFINTASHRVSRDMMRPTGLVITPQLRRTA